MKLSHNTIPQEFLSNIPRGMKYVMRNGKDFLVVEQLFCPHGHSLMVDNVRLHGEPSINLVLRVGETEGMIFLDSFWGSHDKLYNFIPDLGARHDAANDVMCPVCRASLLQEQPERQCGACGSGKVFAMLLPGSRNRILACSVIGCPWHRIIAEDVPDHAAALVDDINYFGL
ncbi:MAG: hypothetical protein MUF04_03640 [Akkermansiaceae bacterium]|jgi:hypothetical protein|nr:hypothetical protein [Akkermansiaceae bacterium]